MQSRVRLFAAPPFVIITALSLGLTGCSPMVIDESAVFLPPAYIDNAPRMGLAGEAQLRVDGITIEHDVLKTNFGPLAITRASRQNTEGETRPLILNCMGNASDRWSAGAAYIRNAIDYGDVIVFDYPGYNQSAGGATEEDFDAAVTAWVDWLAATAPTENRPLIAWGQSLGGFICSEIVSRSDVFDGVIIETSAQNAEQVAASWIPWFAKPFLRVEIKESLRAYDSANALANFEGPILVLGAGRDEVLKVKLARELAIALDAKNRDVTYVEFPHASHGNLPQSEGFDAAATAWFATVK